MKNYGPWPHDLTPEGKRTNARAMQQARDELDRIHPSKLNVGNPNHPNNSGLFGQDPAEFMKRQY